MKQVSNSVVIDGKEVFVFKVCDSEAVVAKNAKEARDFYKKLTGLDGDYVYKLEEVQEMDINTEFYEEEGIEEFTTFKKDILESKDNIPYVICSWY